MDALLCMSSSSDDDNLENTSKELDRKEGDVSTYHTDDFTKGEHASIKTKSLKRKRNDVIIIDANACTNVPKNILTNKSVTKTPVKPLHPQRNIPHLSGNWCSHIYLSVDYIEKRHMVLLKEWARREIYLFQERLSEYGDGGDAVVEKEECIHISTPLPMSDINSCSDFSSDGGESYDEGPCEAIISSEGTKQNGWHISISRPFYLQLQSIDSFVSDLKDRLSFIAPFRINFHVPSLETDDEKKKASNEVTICPHAEVLVNDQGTRTFLVLPAAATSSTPTAPIINLIGLIDKVVAKYGGQEYYRHPRIHISIASVLGDVRPMLKTTTKSEGNYGLTSGGDRGGISNKTTNASLISVLVNHVHCSFGSCKYVVIPLARYN
mmetsp:Transcript_18099/g.25573  ORF Transcript_18099/g.25573 Transcript_18099/m.25573 type:complete len:380 (+) Transcript_18099:29-1168(+)